MICQIEQETFDLSPIFMIFELQNWFLFILRYSEIEELTKLWEKFLYTVPFCNSDRDLYNKSNKRKYNHLKKWNLSYVLSNGE